MGSLPREGGERGGTHDEGNNAAALEAGYLVENKETNKVIFSKVTVSILPNKHNETLKFQTD